MLACVGLTTLTAADPGSPRRRDLVAQTADGDCPASHRRHGRGGRRSRQDDTPVPGGLSARNANYDIDVRLDHATRTLTGTGIIRWRNIGLAPADSLRLHLYWNAWRNNHIQLDARAARWPARRSSGRPRDWSYIDVTALALANADGSAPLDLMPGFAYVQPDDANPEDRTLAAVALPSPVPPGGE